MLGGEGEMMMIGIVQPVARPAFFAPPGLPDWWGKVSGFGDRAPLVPPPPFRGSEITPVPIGTFLVSALIGSPPRTLLFGLGPPAGCPPGKSFGR